MLQGSFGSKPWSSAGAAAAAESAAADERNEAGPGATAALTGEGTPAAGQGNTPHIPDSAEDEIKEMNDMDEDEKAKNEEIKKQLVIDDVVKELIEMELKQRKKDGDTEGFEAGSEHWLKFNIWKVEQDWRKQKDNEAKKESTLETADYFNKPELEKKATKQNKGEEHSKSIWGGHEGTGDLNKPICDLDMGWEWAEEQVIPRTCSQFSSSTGW